MIELPVDFRDLLVELVDASAEFVVVGENKRAAGRPQDLLDIQALEPARRRR